ncbi:MAG: flavin reductase [Oscillospiraceae bacterium]|nr:flavin reductase [Oscillospiraceae bacterium]
MKTFKQIKPNDIPGNIIQRISEQWMLISAKEKDSNKFNMMTASWGMAGFMWNKPVIMCVIRPHRYTYEFTEESDVAAFTFFGDEYRDALNFCGSKSGRDYDKAKETGLTPCFDINGAVYFGEAELVIIGKKLYVDNYKEENFVVPQHNWYPNKDYHRTYIYEITDVLIRSD